MTDDKNYRIWQLKTMLKNTDYIMSQITEAEQFHPEDVEALRSKYANVVIERITWRKEIQELENENVS